MAMSCPPITPTGELFSEDLINEILLRLPVKSLIRFKAVSTTWLSLISSPSFIKTHLRRANQTLIVHIYDQIEENNTSISLLHLDSRQLVADLKFPYSEGEFPFVPECIIVGSSNGIVCVCIAVSDPPPEQNWLYSVFGKRQTNTYLWNPATKQSKLIPPHTINGDTYRVALGFGFDPIDNDFKVVKVGTPPFSAEVYSANKNVWRKLPQPIDIPYYDDFDVCVNGFMCCTGWYGMMAFDLNKEVLNCAIKFPVGTFDARITEFNDSIAVVLSKHKGLNAKINLWTLDDETCLRGGGVEASWTLMFSVDVDLPVQFALGYFNSRDLLLITQDDVWFLYNSEKKEARNVPALSGMNQIFQMHQIFKYTESLVAITGSKQVNWNAHEDDN